VNLSAELKNGNIGLGSQEHLLEDLTQLEQQRSKILMQQGKLMLQAAKERAQQAGITDPITSQRHGSVTESLIDLEDIIRVLVLGVRGEGHGSSSRCSWLPKPIFPVKSAVTGVS
jgi:nucleotide-binding universal stress UspA family protein